LTAERDALAERLKQLEPGRVETIVNAMFDAAEQFGHPKYSSKHALTFFIEQAEQAKVLAARVVLLEGLLWTLRRGGCWCDMAIGNPMVHFHSDLCESIRAALEPPAPSEESRSWRNAR